MYKKLIHAFLNKSENKKDKKSIKKEKTQIGNLK